MAHARYEQAISQFVPTLAAEQENFYSDPALSPHDMSSPHTAPTLDEYTSGSEIDLFISQDSSEQVRDEFANMTSNGLSDFSAGYSFVDSAGFPPSSMYSTFPEKTFSGLSTLDESYVDQIDTLSQEFLNDP
jgi:regulatory protein SWI5